MSDKNTSSAPSISDRRLRIFRILGVTTILYTITVIVYGAWVRVSFSGAGCGQHWPTCKGQIIPVAPTVETIVEFSHRLTSGLSLILVVVLFALALRWFPRKHLARKWAGLSLAFMISEALVGAGLVLFGLVDTNSSVARAVVMNIHLVNTSLLIACMVCAAYWGGFRDPKPRRLPSVLRPGLIIGALAILVTSMSGAVTALGDTLHPPSSTSAAIHHAINGGTAVNFLVRLRIYHPMIAIAAGLIVAIMGIGTAVRTEDSNAKRWGYLCAGLVLLQMTFGFINIGLMAPAWMQLLHLGTATVLWCCYISLLLHLRLPSAQRVGSSSEDTAVRSKPLVTEHLAQ